MALRTAGMPPRSSCSATGSCSGRNSASAALRFVDTGWSRRGRSGRSERTGRETGGGAVRAVRAPARSPRSGRSGRPARSVPALTPSRCGRPSRPGRPRPGPGARSDPGAPLSPLRRGGAPRPGAPPRRGRSPRPSSSRRRLPGTRTTDTPPGPLSRPDPTISMRAAFSTLVPSLGVSTAVTTMPSRSKSASARKTSPTLAPSGRRAPSRDPRGWRAPGRATSTCRRRDCWSARCRFFASLESAHATVGTDTARTCPSFPSRHPLCCVSVEVLRIRAESRPGHHVRSLV